MSSRALLSPVLILILSLLVSACGATAQQVIPTERPTSTATHTPSPTRTPGANSTPTPSATLPPMTATGGPSPTPLFGPTRTAESTSVAQNRPSNPNAPRIEFFTSDVLALAPGSSVTLFWSTRGANGATIYRLNRSGVRTQLWNVPPDGSLVVATNRNDRIQVDFVLSVGEGAQRMEQTLSLPLSCPDAWFFEGGPETCPDALPQETVLVEQGFERGRMIYVAATSRVYALFNDGLPPAWVAFDNRFDPAVHPESEASFVPPPNYYQPLRQLGFVWRGNDLVRNRLGLGTAAESRYDGFVQRAATPGGEESLYISSGDGTVLLLVPGGEAWQIITPS